jgi:hypothetical protein
LSEIEASSTLAKQSGFTGLATGANVTAAQTAIVGEINANETKIDTLQTAVTAIPAAPSVAAIRAELETSTVLTQAATQLGPFAIADASSADNFTVYGEFEAPFSWGPHDDNNVVTYQIRDVMGQLVHAGDVFVLGTGSLQTARAFIANFYYNTYGNIPTYMYLRFLRNGVACGQASLLYLPKPATLTQIEGSTVLAKESTVESRASQATVDAIKAKTDNLPASPAAVGSAMALIAEYDPAKSAASQTSVDAIPASVWGAGERTLNGPLFK